MTLMHLFSRHPGPTQIFSRLLAFPPLTKHRGMTLASGSTLCMYICSPFEGLKQGAFPKGQLLLGEGASALDIFIVSAKPSQSVSLSSLLQQSSGHLRPPSRRTGGCLRLSHPRPLWLSAIIPSSCDEAWHCSPRMETRTVFPFHLNWIKRGRVATPQAT